MKVSIIIPTMNEERIIGKIIKEISKKYEILVIDKSKDNTFMIAKKAGAKVVKQKSKGKGNAMKEAAKIAKGDIIVFLDGDGTYDVPSIPKLISKVGEFDAVYGARIPQKGAMKFTHKIGNLLFAVFASILYQKTSDLLTGFIAIKKDVFNSLNLKSSGFEIETELFIKLQKKGYHIGEIKTPYYKREGKAKLSGFNDGLKILKTLIINRFRD